MKDLRIVPECYVDTKLTEILLRQQVNHQHGSGDVARQLKTRLTNRPAIGIIDEDARKGIKPSYFSEFSLLRHEHHLQLKKHISHEHFLIVICPEIEMWLLNNALQSKIDLTNYQLSTDIKSIIKKTKTNSIHKDTHFEMFIKDLVKFEAAGIVTLNSWLKEFRENH